MTDPGSQGALAQSPGQNGRRRAGGPRPPELVAATLLRVGELAGSTCPNISPAGVKGRGDPGSLLTSLEVPGPSLWQRLLKASHRGPFSPTQHPSIASNPWHSRPFSISLSSLPVPLNCLSCWTGGGGRGTALCTAECQEPGYWGQAGVDVPVGALQVPWQHPATMVEGRPVPRSPWSLGKCLAV